MINQRWLVYESSLGKHGVKTLIDLRRTFGFPYLKYGAKWSQWEIWFLPAFVMKTSISVFSSNEHEMNLNKRRRQPQSARLGVLVFLCRNFLDFWFLLPPSWGLFLAKFARYCKFFQDRAKNSKKTVAVFSRQAKINKSFAKETRESSIKVIQDYSSFSCILQQICYLQPFLTNQFFFQKSHLFFSITAQLFRTFPEILLILSHATANLRCFATFEKVQGFSEKLSLFVKQLKFLENFVKTAIFSRILQQNCYL